MRILIVGPIVSPIIRRLKYHLIESGYDVIVASHNADNIDGVIDLGKLKSFFGYFNFFKINKIVKQYQPDVVHAHVLNHYGLMCIAQSKPLVVALWGSDVMLAANRGGVLKRLFYKTINMLVLMRADRLHTSALHVAKEASNQFQKSADKVDVFYWGFPLKKPDMLNIRKVEDLMEAEFGLVGNRYIVFPRGLGEVYNPCMVAKIICKILQAGISNRIVVLKGFANNIDVKRFSEMIDMSKIIFINRLLDENELYYLYKNSSIHISIPISDSLGGGVIEPALLGSYPVLSNLPSYRAYLKNNSGYLLEDYTDRSLDKFLVDICENNHCKADRAVPPKQYDLQCIMKRINDTYHAAIAKKIK